MRIFKRGGARTILIYQVSVHAFFIFGYAKNEKENIDSDELLLARDFAKEVLSYSEQTLDKLILSGRLIEVHYDGKKFN
ncbi:MAG: Protein containing DUF1044 [uncultured bacterium]|nr:MAG: Protein containing DUF1044 [uncultured bacterium]OGT25259.1 MAG: hypothetical protein A3B71_01990 [Gammaproteobacteria bacterium RIFCSPHIGHO2_02_FULL_42_43]OGT28098.1 MAG: hypothetical protein A2624_01750 [Gammaproteobacteria bacterium RIFCSPHIGHO2_01_FULL_42_8]OGT51212.1 MAG: hypothetical protein A3E54_03180 [Gammaproteobacteria bacterium RIFCSPHIGHO2_12_FULL_41_25]OGT62973.1 MAG: hypothetical protein A3I77_05425 [Gammaproteobacteria bacterium RIFCSPLOWO2_02_FULL_42_14]OGT86106.1 MAG: